MNMKKIAGVVAGAALALGLSAPASAAISLTAGDYSIIFAAYDAGTIGYGETAGLKCTTVASCNTAASQKAPKSYNGEDTWGIFSVQTITKISDGSIVFSAGNGTYLTGLFGGIQDYRVNVSGDPLQTSTLGTGGWLRMYENTQNYNSSLGPNGRTGEYAYTGITGGTLALSAVFGAGGVAGNSTATYSSSFLNGAISGSGNGFLDVVDGSMKSVFDKNSQIDPNGNAHDLFLTTTYSQTGNSKRWGWTVNASGHVEGAEPAEVPEPASLALFGLGLAGLAALRRRRA